jgi:hypothetical protein
MIRNCIVLFFILASLGSTACTCPPTELSLRECEKYEIIFRGKVISVKDCDSKFGEALFEVEELYKGNATKEFKVLFECAGECVQEFNSGDEWIIYSRYKQIDNAIMDWCSRSRKYFKIAAQDFYLINYGNDYEDELKFLRENFGNHRLLAKSKTEDHERNKRPSTSQTLTLLLSSIAAVVLFYYLFNKFFR